ncbi:sulfatase family protein [Haloarchaeobius amylolyticus]|uniref:sulfatase family protein n=1 Tax=Haloarchaeobius amylolyticus TaxID=1198296 RepID=UPI002271BCB2|nr:sulfatase [Haloarchaeobius amylolyticus]
MKSSVEEPNILLVVCDTLRPDYISPYNKERETPFFDRFAESGTIFEQAFAAGPGSSISHAALFSGQYPSTNGVGGQVDFPPTKPHIADLLREAGYTTFGMPGPSRIGSHWNYDRGFEEYLEKWKDIPSSISFGDLKRGIENPSLVSPMPKEVLRRAVYGDDDFTSYLIDVFSNKTQSLEEPWFSFINITTAHGPYNPPRPYKQKKVPELNRSKLGFLEPITSEYISRQDVHLDKITEMNDPSGFAKLLADSQHLSTAELETMRALYEASVDYLDNQLSRLFGRLESSGALDNTIVVLVSDHGEHLGENGLTRHMYFHFEPCLHVPLMMSGPSIPAGSTRSDFVSLIDILPTLCGKSNIAVPASVDGQDLFEAPPRDAVFAENGVRETPTVFEDHLPPEMVDRLGRGLKSIRTTEHLYTIDSSGEERLYDRESETELPNPDPESLTRYRNRVHETLGTEFPPGSQEESYSEAIRQDLEHLGYLE